MCFIIFNPEFNMEKSNLQIMSILDFNGEIWEQNITKISRSSGDKPIAALPELSYLVFNVICKCFYEIQLVNFLP